MERGRVGQAATRSLAPRREAGPRQAQDQCQARLDGYESEDCAQARSKEDSRDCFAREYGEEGSGTARKPAESDCPQGVSAQAGGNLKLSR